MMTREKTLKKIKDNKGSILELEFFINKIYDDFENRRCTNCKHYQPSLGDIQEGIEDQWLECDNLYVETRDLCDLKYFSCNRWEVK
jgi:hypothetical protein